VSVCGSVYYLPYTRTNYLIHSHLGSHDPLQHLYLGRLAPSHVAAAAAAAAVCV